MREAVVRALAIVEYEASLHVAQKLARGIGGIRIFVKRALACGIELIIFKRKRERLVFRKCEQVAKGYGDAFSFAFF